MNVPALAIAALIVIIVIVAGVSLWRYRRMHRRHTALRQLLDDADRLESDLKACRQQLDRAHAVMAVSPDVPVTGENNARQAVDAGLRSLLEHRLWIRDRAPLASQKELEGAAMAMSQARAKLESQLRALDQAQRELEQAVRKHIDPE
ncbi:MAG TPA: hypothetical protein VFL78_11530 [Rhodanobacteraceae bacterium]|nr:hypothetical protein [Rhodanobacteraceae bacterium]